MKRKKTSTLPKDLQRAIDLFPTVVASNKAKIKKLKFIEDTFGELARRVHRQQFGKPPKKS